MLHQRACKNIAYKEVTGDLLVVKGLTLSQPNSPYGLLERLCFCTPFDGALRWSLARFGRCPTGLSRVNSLGTEPLPRKGGGLRLEHIRPVSHRPQRVNPLSTKWPPWGQREAMFFYALWWSFVLELDAIRTVSHRPQRVNPLPTGCPCPGTTGDDVFSHPLMELCVGA
jgi:hypothetical protein